MTNEQWLKSLSTGELADYIYAVFTSGVMCGKGLIEQSELINYKNWLNEPFTKNR